MRRKNRFNETLLRSFDSSLIFHIPHASMRIPNSLREQFLLSDDELENELLKMTDHSVDELFASSIYHRVISDVSRMVCDVERFVDDAIETMAQRGMGVIYKKTHDDKALRRELSLLEREHLIRKYHYENQTRMERIIKEALMANGIALVIDCHTFSSKPLPCDMRQSTPRVDFCIGTDSFHTSLELIRVISSYFCEHGYRVKLNSPFEGTYIPHRYNHKDERVESIMIEIHRTLYMDENDNNN